MTIPKGFTRHKGGDCPVDPEQFVVCIIRTKEGLGYSAPSRARLHEWRDSEHKGGIGAIVAYRLAEKTEPLPALHERWAEVKAKPKK